MIQELIKVSDDEGVYSEDFGDLRGPIKSKDKR